MTKGPEAFRTISEVAEALDLPQHVLRFWETRFKQIKPMKRGGGRRYYRPEDVALLGGIRHLLYGEGYTIRGVQRILKEQGVQFVMAAGRGEAVAVARAEKPDEPAVDRAEAEPAPARPSRPPVPPQPDTAGARLSADDVGRLQATLTELVELKRMLDRAR